MLVCGIVLGVYQNHRHAYQHVLVQLPTNVKVSIYKDLGGDGAYNYNPNSKPIATLSTSKKVALKRGVYDFVADNPAQKYTNPVSRQTIDYSTSSVTLQLSYSDEILATILPEIKTDALNALYQNYPDIQQNYTISKEQLYMLGDWYGVVLQPNDSSLDTLRAILHKDNNHWQLVSGQPDLSIGEPSHPNIPPQIIEQVDQL